jgi:signal peptidase complex subunit 1
VAQAIAFIAGYLHQDIKQALVIGLGGTILTFVLIVPPWPLFNRHPVKWLPAGGSDHSAQAIVVDGMIVS